MIGHYPAIHPYETHELQVSDLHTIYVEECGSADGIPVCFVHGGPGGGCIDTYRRFFDPNEFRIILFDQRGCGRSTPHAELHENTTQHLIADMELIREKLGIKKWMLFGGSWGSTLSLVYAQTHPERVLGLILRGIFLNRPSDVDWLIQPGGASNVFPDYWERFVEIIPENERHNMLQSYYDLLTGDDDIARMQAAKRWAEWEASCSTHEPNPETVKAMREPHIALSLARLEAHYFMNNCFLEPNQIMQNIHRLENIPGVIVHGRYDMVCSLDNAWTLNKAWPDSELLIVRDAGHSAGEPGIVDALIRATQRMAKELQTA